MMAKKNDIAEDVEPWNKDRAVGQMRPFDPDQAAHIRDELTLHASKTPARLRDLALFNLGLDAMCRASEILSLTVGDITDHLNRVVEEFEVLQEKTGQTKTVTLGRQARRSLQDWIDFSDKKPDAFLWSSIGNRKSGDKPLSRMQYSRLVKDWAAIARLDRRRFSTHSMRRTKSSLIYEQTKNLRACQHLLGHKSIGSTAEYLGVDKRAALAVAKRIKI
ncbi:MAG: tyrosine-type recombinase/integrase [Pseudomonadota bacterium]